MTDKSSLMLDFAEQQGGFEKPPNGLGQETCPKCGSGTIAGYGLMGGGIGGYVMCDGEKSPTCEWFYKRQDEDNQPPGQSKI
jgi:hypothetical protein